MIVFGDITKISYLYFMEDIKEEIKPKLVRFNLSLFEELEYAAKASGRSVEAQIRHYVNYGINSESNNYES